MKIIIKVSDLFGAVGQETRRRHCSPIDNFKKRNTHEG